MKREEALNLINDLQKKDCTKLVKDTINLIYNDFESRTCKNCKLEYDKLCPISDLNHPIKYCSEWKSKCKS